MMSNQSPAAAVPEIREFRTVKGVWAIVFVLFAGPLNPAGWYLGRPDDGYVFLKSPLETFWIVLFPTTVIAAVMARRMWRAQRFTMNDLWLWASLGFAIALFTGPMGLLIADIAVHGLPDMDWREVVPAYFMFIFFGWLFGIIPFFATTIGLPCALVAMMLAYACTKPVD